MPEAGEILIDAKTMLGALDKPGIAILDVRDVDEWIGDSSSPYGKDFCPRKGRIPGAVWLEWYRMMKPTAEGPRFKSKDEILAECATVGISETTPVYLYCFKGARASNTFLALKNAGVKDVRMYFGSWNEWSRDPSLPIDEGLPTAAGDGKGGVRRRHKTCMIFHRPAVKKRGRTVKSGACGGAASLWCDKGAQHVHIR